MSTTKLSATKLRAIINEEVVKLLESVEGGELLTVGQVREWKPGMMKGFPFRAFKILGVTGWSIARGGRHGSMDWSGDAQGSSAGDVNDAMKISIQPMAWQGGKWVSAGSAVGIDVASRDVKRFSVPA
jgi:hypothetical protein